MKQIISYTNEPAPKHKAVEDIKFYLGDQYDNAAMHMKAVTDTYDFHACCAMFLGIEGFPVKAWFDHFHGEGAWAEQEHTRRDTHGEE